MGLSKMHAKLVELDPVSAKRIHPNDPQRLLRALEVYQLTGKPMSALWQNQTALIENYKVTQVAIFPEDRALLHHAIAERFQLMLKKGFVDEVQNLRERGDLNINLPSMRCVGYRQIWQYLEGVDDYPTMQEKAIAATRQLAKRQLTWLRHWENLQCFATAQDLKTFFMNLYPKKP
jgi:tRNA dimethylallyltransferase